MMLAVGQVLQNRYRILSFLSQGGMGAVYCAGDVRLTIQVAVKEMTPQPDLAAHVLAQLRQQFQREAATLARLNHSHLVRVTDFFEEDGNAYLVMDHIEGESLAARIERQGALPESQVLQWAAQLLDALEYCHDQGVIHRDVKPQNVILRPDGQAVLVDFGLLKLWDPRDPRTKTAMRGMGTPEYAPPEQYESDTAHTSPSSDVYGLGATIYHALCGQAPPTATLRMAMPEAFVPLRHLSPGVSAQTEMAVLKALELVRSQRWQSAGEMAAALHSAAPPRPAVAPTRPPARTAVLPESHPLQAARPVPPPAMSPPAPVAPPRQAAAPPRQGRPRWLWIAGGLVISGVVASALLVTGVIGGDGARATAAPEPTSARVQYVAVPTSAAPTEGRNLVYYYGFNVTLPPFDNPAVRQAFALAIDRQTIVNQISDQFAEPPTPATTLTPPDVLGLELYGQVGLPYDPERARSLLADAGYPNGAGLPAVSLFFSGSEGSVAEQVAQIAQQYWRDVLGVEVTLVNQPWETHSDLVYNDPPQIWSMGWAIDHVDPYNVLHDAICNGYNSDFYNDEATYTAAVEAIANAPSEAARLVRISTFGAHACIAWEPTRFRWDDDDYEALLQDAVTTVNAEARRMLYVEAERMLCEENAVLIPLYTYHRSP